MPLYTTRGFIVERNMDSDTFRLLGAKKIVHDRKWLVLRGFIPKIVHEFYVGVRTLKPKGIYIITKSI